MPADPIRLADDWPLLRQHQEHVAALALLERAKVPAPDGFDGAELMAQLERQEMRLTMARAGEGPGVTNDQRLMAGRVMKAATDLAEALREALGLPLAGLPRSTPHRDFPDAMKRIEAAGVVPSVLRECMAAPAAGTVLSGQNARVRLPLLLSEVEALASAEPSVTKQLAAGWAWERGSGTAEMLGEHLPRLFQRLVGRRCGVSLNGETPGEGLRFLIEAAKHCGVDNPTPDGVFKTVQRQRRKQRGTAAGLPKGSA